MEPMADAEGRSVSFSVPEVRGKQRARTTRARGTYTPAETRRAMELVQTEWLAATSGTGMPRPLFAAHEPVAVSVTTYRPLPARRPARVAAEPDTYRPDLDNVAKLVLDALDGLAWEDDAQVTYLMVTKMARRRGQGERVEVRVWPAPSDDEGEVAGDGE